MSMPLWCRSSEYLYTSSCPSFWNNTFSPILPLSFTTPSLHQRQFPSLCRLRFFTETLPPKYRWKRGSESGISSVKASGLYFIDVCLAPSLSIHQSLVTRRWISRIASRIHLQGLLLIPPPVQRNRDSAASRSSGRAALLSHPRNRLKPYTTNPTKLRCNVLRRAEPFYLPLLALSSPHPNSSCALLNWKRQTLRVV